MTTRAQLLQAVWSVPDLTYRMHSGQEEVSRQWRAHDGRLFVVQCSRRWGKSYWLCLEVIMEALRTSGAPIRYATPTQKMAKNIVAPHMAAILADCPEHLAPRYYRQENIWVYPNKAEVHLAGCDGGGAERLRGTATRLAALDEAGFIAQLKYVTQDILLPQTLTTDGLILIASSPAKTPGHEFTDYCARAEAEGGYAHRTIYDAPHITPELIREFIAESGGEHTTTWRREYLAETVIDEDAAIVPEFISGSEHVITEWERPRYFTAYTVADIGFVDLSFWIFGYYDFENASLIIEDELVRKHATTGEMVPEVLERERALWGAEHRVTRWADAEPLVIAEFGRQHRMPVLAARRDDPEAAVNALRLAVASHRIRIHPRCKQLIRHLKSGTWRDSQGRRKFDRSPGLGHYDGVAALMYAWRHVDKRRNPFPALPPEAQPNTHRIRADTSVMDMTDTEVQLTRLGGRRKRRAS